MGAVYGWSLLTLLAIGLVGAVAAGFGISPLAMDRVGVLARVIGSLTAAGLLGFAFLVDKLADPAVDLSRFFQGAVRRDAIVMVTLLIAAGATGLLAAAVVAIFDEPTTTDHPRLAGCGRWLLRWAGGCLATATIAVIVLFPAAIVLILQAGDALRGG